MLLINKDNNNNGETINVREEEPGQHKQNEKEEKKWENDNNVDLLTTMGTGRATTKIANRPQRQPIACNEK